PMPSYWAISVSINKENNYGLSITFRDAKARDEAIAYLSKRHPDLVISSQGSNQLRAVMSDARLSEAREYAVHNRDFSFIIKQNGMFSFSGLTKEH
ncbi:hypothetical protein NE615_28600, partial [Escherichia coli]|nr:hypothetical protein [Escherichia coli]